MPTTKIPTFTAHAKINLSLVITDKLSSGYHTLDSLVTHTQYGDTITVQFTNNNHFTMEIIGEFADELDTTNNSVMAGANMIYNIMTKNDRDSNDIPLSYALPCLPFAHITLTKNLPISSGIGGGSSDCACIIRALLLLWDKTAPSNLDTHLLKLGADVPVCFAVLSCIMQGIGEQIKPHPIPVMNIVLCNPNIAVSTPEVFGQHSGAFNTPVQYPTFNNTQDLVKFLNATGNQLTAPAKIVCPDIKTVLNILKSTKPMHVGMSGSGATCFALCKDKDHAESIAKICKNNGYWAIATQTV